MPIYEYWYGFMCAECGRFNALNSYQTTVPGGVVDVDLGEGPFGCKHCAGKCTYQKHDVVFSQQPGEMVPLDRPQ